MISIIIPTYNRAHLIGETLDSVLAQTYQDWECIVVDDGSTDNTESVVNAFAKADSRFSYHRRPENRPKGANACRNYGFELSKGEFINWMDSDDLISENKLKFQVEKLERKDIIKPIVTCKWGVFEDNISEVNFFENLRVYKNYEDSVIFFTDLFNEIGYFPSHCYLISRKIILLSGGWNEFLKINQDGEFFIRCISYCSQILFSEKSLAYYRSTRSDSVSLISRENVSDYYNSWKLIESYLKVRFKGEMDEPFERIKVKSFRRIPSDFAVVYHSDKVFYHDLIKRNRWINKFKRKLIKLVKIR